jgi:hypothetical protein
MTARTFLLVLAFIVTIHSFAQKIKVEGNLGILKGQTAIKTEFTYDNLVVGAGIREDNYIAGKVQLWNEKEAGKGEEWQAMWFANRKKLFEPAFRKTLAEATGISATEESTPYILIFKTIHTEPGWSGGVIGGVGTISAEAWFVDPADKTKPLAKIIITDAKGKDHNGGDFESGRRLQQAYISAAKYMAWYIHKARRKK